MKFIIRLLAVLFFVFIFPGLAHLAWWSVQDRPARWHEADWTSAGIFPKSLDASEAIVHVMSARTGGLKGALSSHSWLLIKPVGQTQFDRYDVVGWGRPVRKNAYPPDGRWYSNTPVIHLTLEGEAASRAIPKLDAAIANYPWRNRGDYSIWPGPNSNTFVASVLRAVPELKASTPTTAVGRDFPSNGDWVARFDNGTIRLSAKGYAGMTLGWRTGLELNFLGLVAGLNPSKLAISIPTFGTFSLF